uniref:Crp/Fnr family transcription regulator n=1 Tax=Listeria ivanovii TaxID=1638 RepID=Q5DU74_LISIV|nr:Crp/Fnr family transcription regulator [Listeria ivanovii]
MDYDILDNYVSSNDFQIITRKKRKYLTYEGLEDSYVYILKKGIIKTSIISRDGREFNLGYINKMDIVSLLKDEYSQFANAPFNHSRGIRPVLSFIKLTEFDFGKTSIRIRIYNFM